MIIDENLAHQLNMMGYMMMAAIFLPMVVGLFIAFMNHRKG